MEEVRPVQVTPRLRLNAELAAIRYGTEVLASHVERGDRFLLMFPMSFETVSSPQGRMEFMSVFRNLPAEYRQYMLIHLVDLPPGITQSRLADLVTLFKPMAKAVVAEIALQSRAYTAYQGIGLNAISMVLWRQQRLSQREALEEITKLTTSAKKIGLATYVAGVSNTTILSHAHVSGVHMISGGIISDPVPAPYPATRLTWQDIDVGAGKEPV